MRFTMKRGKVVSESDKQHRFLHARLNEGDHAGDHTHVEDGKRVRHTVETMRESKGQKHASFQKPQERPRTRDGNPMSKDRGDTWTRLFGPS